MGIASLRTLKLGISLLSVTLSAMYFGLSFERDSWLIAMTLSPLLIGVLLGPINEVFRAKYIHIRFDFGEKFANETAHGLINFILILSSALILIVIIYSSVIASLLGPNLTLAEVNQVSEMIKIVIPSMILTIASMFNTSLANCHEIYYMPEYFGIVSSLLNIIFMVVLQEKFGIYSLVIASYVTQILYLLILGRIANANKVNLFLMVIPKLTHLKPYISAAVPFYFNYAISQVIQVSERPLALLLGPGYVSMLDYSRRFVDIPGSVIQSSISTIVTPTVSHLFKEKNISVMSEELVSFIKLLLYAYFPFFTVILVCRFEIISVLLNHGRFLESAIIPTGEILGWFSFGVIGIILFSLSSQSLIACGKGKIVAYVSVISGIIALGINITLSENLGINVFAISFSFSHIVAGIFLLYFLVISVLKNTAKMLFLILKPFILIYGFAIILLFLKSNISDFNINHAPSIMILICSFVFLVAILLMSVALYHFDNRLFNSAINHLKKLGNRCGKNT